MPEKMPKITLCQVHECAYNEEDACHAFAITVGGAEPICDTSFVTGSRHGGRDGITAGVGACKSYDCTYNEELTCSAQEIAVKVFGGTAKCDTFKQRAML